MTPYISTQSPFNEHLTLHARAVQLVARVDDETFPVLRCHELARALSIVLDTPYQDGHFQGCIEHTWLPLPEAILDPYMPGVVPHCVLVGETWVLPLEKLYIADEERDDIQAPTVEALVELFSREDAP